MLSQGGTYGRLGAILVPSRVRHHLDRVRRSRWEGHG
jgi:hypothetical protein